MTTEHLKWLELSAPTEIPPEATLKEVESGDPPCPTCGWPITGQPDQVKNCPHCGHVLTPQPAGDLLAALNVTLPPRTIEVLPAPPHWFQDTPLDSLAMYQLRLQAGQFQVTSGFDRLICLDDISVDHYQHQLEAALHALRDMRGRALLADEVGLGKTIEAGIVMKELIERGLVRSILILTPASLTWQWQEEMAAKFHETFQVLEKPKQLTNTPTPASCRWIISLDRAKSNRWAKQLLNREYDLLIVDEAHKLKNQRTKVYKFVSQIQKRYVLMLTATPVHNNLMELYNLISILRPGHLGTKKAFRDNFLATEERRAGRRTIYSSSYPDDYLSKSKPARLTYRGELGNDSWINDRTENFADLADLKLDKNGQQAVAEIKQLLTQGYEIFDFEAIRTGGWISSYDFVCRLKLKPKTKIRERQSTVKRRTTPRNPAALRELLREIMIRNRRSKVGVRFPPRKAAVYYLNLTPPERELYDGVTTYIREQLRLQTEQTGKHSRGALRMTLVTLQRQLCSSPQAVARSLENLINRQPDPALSTYLTLAQSIKEGRKVLATKTILEQYPAKTLIFTDYLPTLHTLQASLTVAGYKTLVFHGGLSSLERVEVVRQFRRSAQVLISTQSGSEGHNLQFCHQMINYDLPWNPMRIEQRVGRLHRLGQKEAVFIFNLSATDTIEAYILDLLAHKIRMFELVIGELDLILGEMDQPRSFEHYIEAAWAGSQSEAELLNMIAELENILARAKGTYNEVRDASDELSDLLDAMDEVQERR